MASLERYGLRWIKKDYSKTSEFEKGHYFACDFVARIFDRIGTSRLIRGIDAHFSVPARLQERMDVLWRKGIYEYVAPVAHQVAAAVFLAKRDGRRGVWVLSFNSLAAIVKEGLTHDVRLIVLPGLGFLGALCETVRRKFSAARLRRLLLGPRAPGGAEGAPDGGIGRAAPQDFRVAFFPHQGVFYGNLFIKDHFYSPDADSPLHRSKILHISVDEKHLDCLSRSRRYYEENGIPNLELVDLGHSKGALLNRSLGLLAGLNLGLLRDLWEFGLDPYLMAGKIFFRLHKYISYTSKLTGLEVALIGYDFEFPIELAMALMLRGVKVCASQERFTHAFRPQTYMIFDYYFVAGTVVTERGLENSCIGHCIPVGLVRVDKLFGYIRDRVPDAKYDAIRRTKKLVLALDYHLPENDYEDTVRIDGKVGQIRGFYGDLIRLAREFPQLHIVIKGKFAENYASPLIADIVREIKGMENLEIETDLDRYDPYFLSEKADLTIACYTSLADELLAAGRKVIFYDVSDFMATRFDYEGLPKIVRTYGELRHSVHDFLGGHYLDKDAVARLKAFYSDCCHGKVRSSIRKRLEDLLIKRAG